MSMTVMVISSVLLTLSQKEYNYEYETDRFYRIESIDGISFTYYENDLRRTKTVSGVTHYYTYEGMQENIK